MRSFLVKFPAVAVFELFPADLGAADVEVPDGFGHAVERVHADLGTPATDELGMCPGSGGPADMQRKILRPNSAQQLQLR